MGTKPPKEPVKEKPTPPAPKPESNPDPPVETLEEQVSRLETELVESNNKFGESSKEGIRLAKEVKELKVKLDKKSDEPPLEKRISGWKDLSPEEQQRHRDKEVENKRLAQLEADRTEEKKSRLFNEGFDGLVEKEEFRVLATQKAKFREYCKENPGPIEEAAKAFLFPSVKKIAAEEERKKIEMDGLEDPSGGDDKSGVKKEGYTLAEAEKIRVDNPDKYNALVRAGKLNIIDE